MRIKDRFRRLFGIDGERAAEHHMDPDGLEGEDVASDDTEAHEHSHGDEHGDDPEDVA